MPESSVKITLGVQLDKSDIDKQLQEMQKELDAYKLKIGVDREQLTQNTESEQSSNKSSPKSFESPENEENIDFGVLSDLANEKFNETFGLIDTVNDSLIEILGEVKAIRGALDGLSPASKTQEGEQVSSAPINSTLDTAVKESGEKITNQLTDIVAVLSTISNQLSEKKEPLSPANLSGETTISGAKPIAGANQSVSEDSTDIVPLVQDAIDKISTNINQATESLSSQFSTIQEIIDIANNSFAELVSTTKSITESVLIDITKIVTNLLDEVLTEIQDSALKLIETTLADLAQQILENISNNSQKNTGKKDSGDDTGSTISSGISSLISVIVRLQEILTTQLGQITGQLFPEIITQLQFDFFKSLIGGAVEKLGAVLINQSAGGAAKLAEGVITGNVFRQSDPAAAATMAFGEGFAANDPALLGSAISQISKKLDVLNPAIAEPSGQAQLDLAPEVETVRMTAVLETIAGNISASNIILDKIVGAIEAGDQDTTEQRRLGGSNQQRQLQGGLAEPIKMIAVLEYVADKIETTNQILEEIQAEVSLISFDSEGQTVSRQSSDNLLPSASDYTDVSFEDIIAQIVPSTSIEIPEIEPDKLASNFTRIIEDVFNEIGISVQQIAKAGKLPQLDIDTDENLPRGSKYNRKANKISVSESIAKDLSSGNNISKDSFIPIVRELRKAIQSEFTDDNYRAKQNKAMRDKGFMVEGVKIPRLIQDNLIDKSQPRLSKVKQNIGNAVKEETNNQMSGYAVKGFTSANTDAEVFAQNLADKLFSTPIDIPEIDQLFRASGGGDKGKESKDKTESLLTDLLQTSDESNVLLREGIQGDRTNIERLSGDKFINESSTQLGGNPTSNRIEGIVNEIKGFTSSLNRDFSNIFDTRLKDFAINASKAVGVPDTGWVDNVTNFVQYLDVFANLLKVINPALADSFGNVRKTVANDGVRFASQGMEGIVRKGTEFYNQVRSNPNLQRDAIANRINQGKDFINAAKNGVTNAIPDELIGQGRDVISAAKNRVVDAIPPQLISQGKDAVGAAKNRIMDAIPPQLISQLQSLQQQVNDSGAIDSLRSVLEKVNNLGGQLLASIGQLINTMGGLINSGESVPAVKDFLGNVQTEINARTKTSNNESLFRADIPQNIWDDKLTQASPEFSFDAQNLVTISPLNMMGDSSMDIPDPWADTEKLSKGNEQKLSGEDNKGQDKVQVDLATFIQKALPIAVAGLVVAKLGTSLLNNVLPGKSNIERKVSVDSLQSTLTKALIGAVTVAIGQKLAPQLSKVFTTDKNVTLSDRIKSLFGKPANVSPQLEPTPYTNLSDDELDKSIADLNVNNLNVSNPPKVSSESEPTPYANLSSDELDKLIADLNVNDPPKVSSESEPTPYANLSSDELDKLIADLNVNDPPKVSSESEPTPYANLSSDELDKLIADLNVNDPPKVSSESEPTPYANLSSDELDKLIANISIDKGTNSSSLDNFPSAALLNISPKTNALQNIQPDVIDLSWLGDIPNIFDGIPKIIEAQLIENREFDDIFGEVIHRLYRGIPGQKPSLNNNPIVDKAKERFASGNISESLKSNGVNLLKLLGGSAIGVLSENLMKFPGRSRSSKETQESFPEKVFKRAFEQVASNLATNVIKSAFKLNSNKDNQESFVGKMFKGLLERFAINFSKGIIKSSIQGDTRQKPLEEKLVRGLFGSLTNQTRTRGRQIDERFASYTGKKRDDGDIPRAGIFESLFSKLPILLTGLIIGRLIADVVPKIVDGFKQGSSNSGIDSVDLSQQSSFFNKTKNQSEIKDILTPSRDSLNIETATKLAQQIAKDSGLSGKEQKALEKDFVDLYISNPEALQAASARTTGNSSALTEMEQLDKNFKAIADKIFSVSGLDSSKIDKAGLFPQVSIDSENKLKGASAYSVKDNQVTLSSDIAKMVSSSEGVSKEAFTTIAHELRHAMQLSFGKNNINAVAAIAQDSNSLPIGKNAKIDLKTEKNLIDTSKTEQISKQVDASLAAIQPGSLSKGIEALEVDAEVFAQNLADVFYGLSEQFPDTLFRESPSVDSLDSISATQKASSPQKEDLPLNKENKTPGISPDVKTTLDSPKIIAAAITGVLTTSLLKSVLTAKVKGEPRQSSIGEKFFNLIGGVIKSPFRIGKSKSEEIVSPGFFDGLVSKLPLILTGLIIAGLLSQVVPALLAGDVSKQTDNATSKEKTEVVKESVDVVKNAEPSQSVSESVDVAKNAEPSQSVSESVDVAKNAELNQSFSESVDYETIAANMAKVAEQILQTSGVDTTTLKSQGLMPNIGIDSENKFKGASVYRGQTNEVLLSEENAKGFIDNKNISKKSFATLAHELRHSMQTNFGQVSGASQAREYKSGAREFTTQGQTINLLGLNDLTDKTKTLDVEKQAMYSTRGVSLDNYNAVKAWEIDAETFAQNLTDAVYGVNKTVPDILPRANVANSGKSLDSRTAVKEKTISSLDKGIKELGKTYKTISSQATSPNLANLVTIDIPDIITKENPGLLDTSLPNLPTEPPVSSDTSLPLPAIASNNQQEDSVLFADSGMGDKGQTILQAIKVSVERIIVLLDNIAAQLGASVSPELNLGAESMSTLDSLYRGVTEDNKKTKKEQGGEKEKTKAVIIGEKIGTKLENAIDNMQSRLNKKMQDAGMSEDDIRGMADQAGGYMFANLSAFFPAGAMGVALAPVITSLSALGIPIAAAVSQLAPIGQMLADTMRTMTPIQTRFETIGGTPENGQQMLDFAAQVAQEYNTPLLASIEGYSRLAAASKGSKLEGQDTEELFKGVSQAMAALGLNAQDASLIFLAFQQVISKGKVAAEELRGQIGERLPGAIQLAAKSMGMSVADFSAALDRGEISSNILLPKLAKAFQEEYGAGAKAASKGFLGTLNKIENSLFNFRRLMTDEFGGIVAGIANAAATALDAVLWLMDNVLLKSGLMFNAILGIQAQIIAGTAFIFSKLDLSMALAKALSGGYGKLSLVLIPFVFGLFQEIIGMVLAKILGVEINNAVEMLTGFFSTLVGRVIQTVIDLSKDPKQVMEGVVNIVRSISIGVKSAAEAFLNLGIAISSSIGVGVDELTWFVKKLGDAERLINKLADNSISKIYAPQTETPQTATKGESSNDNGFASIFNGKAIARASLEFFSLFAIMIQTMVLLRIIGEQVFKAGEAFKVFGGKFKDALISMKTGKSILSMLTLGFSGLNLLLAGLATLVVLMAFKSSSTNSFLSQLSNSVKALEGLNKNLDNLTNRKIEITTEITQLDQAGVRDTPFQDKGLTISFWRAKDQEQFTTDDVIRMIQKRIDSTAYRRDLPLLPDNFSESRGSLFDQGNLSGLGNVLTSQVGKENQPTSFDELISLKDKLAEERKSLEDYLTLYLQLDTTNTFDELTRLKNELGDVDSQLADVQQKREKLGKRSSIGEVFNRATNALRGEGNLPGLNEGLVETVKLFRDITKYTPGLGAGASGVSASPRLVTNLLIGAESLDYTETEVRLNQRRAELQSQINSFEQQRALNPGSDTMIGLTPLEAQIETLKKELKTVDNKIEVTNLQDNISIPMPGFGFQELVKTAPTPEYAAIQDFSRLTERDKLLRRRESIAKSIEELQKTIGASVDDLEKEIRQKTARIDTLTIKTGKEGKNNSKEITALTDEVNLLLFQREATLAANKREELARVNQDLRAIQTFATTPGVFNNAFNQDDTVLREMVSQQLDVFSMVQNDRINPQRLSEGNLISVLPELQRDVQKERDLTANRIREIEEEIARLDTTGEGAKDKLAALNKELKSFNNRLVGLKGLNIFLDISQSYADLGAGKQELQNTRITRSLTRLSQALKDNPVQSEALQQFQKTPTLPNLAQLEQSILIDLVPAQQAVTRAKSERENIATTPMLRTEQDLRSAGYVTKEQKQQLDVFRALEESVQREIQSARKTVSEAYSDYNQATAEGLDFQPALDNYYAVSEQLKELQTQLQELRAERDAFLDEVKTVAPPIQVDDKAREQRLAEVDQAIKEAESRVNELAKQYQLIQETKSGLGGLGQLGENLDVAAAKLREPLKGFAAIWEFATRRREGAAKIMEQRSNALNPALETVGGFINQQQNLSGGARAGLVGALNSGDYAMTKTALESITIQDGKIFFNGEELTGTNEEIATFTKALKTASRILGFIGNDSTKGSRPVQQAIEEAFGIKTVDTQRAEISNQYFSQIASLATSGIFSESQLMGLTQDGLKLADAQKILDEVKNRDGLTNFQSVIQTLQDQGATPGEIRDVLNGLQGLEQTFVDALALDPKGATKVRLGTVGEEEYTQTIGKLDQIAELATKSSEKLGLQYYDGNINTWMNALKDVKPGFLENIQQLRTIEEELTRIGQKRIEVNEQLTRTDLSKDKRKALTAQATQLDETFKTKYREKKVAGADLTEAFMFYQNADKELSLLAEEIAKSDLSQQIKDATLAQIKQTRGRYVSPGLEALKQFEDLMSLSGEEALEAAGKSITRALENFEKIAKQIDSVTQQKLADITTALLEFSSNKALAITDLNKSVAGLAGDPEKLAAEQDLAIAQVNAQQSLEKLNAAKKTKEDVDRNVEIAQQKAAFSPNSSQEQLEPLIEKQIEALNIFSQAQEEYSQNIKALTEARLAKIEADTQIPVRISQFNSKQKNINYKQQQLDGVLKESDVTKLQLQDEIGLLDIEIASTASELEAIAKGIKDGYITNIDDANQKISKLVDKQQDLISNRLDKLLEQENEERERSIKLLEDQSSLSAKYFDLAINGYELLNKETERYTKQLDNLTQIGEQLRTLSQAQFQVNIGKGETGSSLIDAGAAARERFLSEDISPRQRAFQASRLGALQQLGQGYGIQPAAFGMNEDAALAEQQKIATKLAREKLDAMEKEQAIAAKLLEIEIQRNQIVAEMAVREAEIGKLRAEQALIQAQFGLQQAILGKDPTAIKLAELELQIAASQQGLANAELGSAQENLALQAFFAQLQRETAKLDAASARDSLIAEVAGNENVDLASILQSLQNFKNFDPTKANPREAFAPYLDWLNKQTSQRDPNTPIGMPLEAFNGDTQAWIDANVAIAKQQQEQASAQTPPEVQSLKNVFDKIFGEPVAAKIDMSNGKVQDISKEIAVLNAGRLGEKVAPTQEMIDSVSGQREIDNALEQARRLAQASEPVDNSRMASDVYSISTDMADAMSTFLTIAELLGLIALNTRGGGEATGGNNPSGGGESTPPGIGDGGNAYKEVQQLLEQLKNARGIKDVLEPIVNETKTEKPWAAPLTGILGGSSGQSQSNPLDLSESIMPTPVNPVVPMDQQSALPPSSDTKVSAILNPTIQNSVTPRFAAPAVNVSTVAQREPGYFYRNLANEVTPQVAYRVPPGVQATQGATSYQPAAQNTTINITNKIDAASQREMYAKIGETQTKAVLSALNKMA